MSWQHSSATDRSSAARTERARKFWGPMLARMRKYKRGGLTLDEIAAKLNQQGFRTQQGKPITRPHISRVLSTAGYKTLPPKRNRKDELLGKHQAKRKKQPKHQAKRKKQPKHQAKPSTSCQVLPPKRDWKNELLRTTVRAKLAELADRTPAFPCLAAPPPCVKDELLRTTVRAKSAELRNRH